MTCGEVGPTQAQNDPGLRTPSHFSSRRLKDWPPSASPFSGTGKELVITYGERVGDKMGKL